MFNPSLFQADYKIIFNELLKKTFELEPTSFIEEFLSSILKEQLAEDGLRVNNSQIQKVRNYNQRFLIVLN